MEAQRTLIQNQQAEVVRINQLYDAELDRSRSSGAGAQPGSLGALPSPAGAALAASAPIASHRPRKRPAGRPAVSRA